MASKGPRPRRPPSDFEKRTNLVFSENRWVSLFRVSARPENECIHFSRSELYRFDFAGAPYGVCYFGLTERAAIVETLGKYLIRRAAIPIRLLENLQLYAINANLARIMELRGAGLTVAGADAQVASGSYAASRLWSKAIMEHPLKFSGIEYHGRVCQESCYALFGDGPAPLPHEETASVKPLGSLYDLRETWIEIDRHDCKVSRRR